MADEPAPSAPAQQRVEHARRESEPGMAALVRGLFQREAVSQSRPPQPSQAAGPASLPSSSVARPTPTSFSGQALASPAPPVRRNRRGHLDEH